jgi:16S rRNA processing protein RimM
MSEQNNKIQIGKIMDAHGIRGDVYFIVFSGDVSWLDQIENVTLKHRKKEEDFEIEKIKVFKKGFIAKLKGFDDRNCAEWYKGAELWVDSSIFVSKHGEAIFLNEILNFKIEDQISGEVGTIRGFSSNGPQDLLLVSSGHKEFEIPFVKEFVLNVDFKNKVIRTSLPEGLLEINDAIGTPDDA